MMDWAYILTNQWWVDVSATYTLSIAFGVSTILTILKIWAVVHPSNYSNEIVCLISGWLYGFPGQKKDME